MTKKKFNDLASTKQKGLTANKGWRKFLPKEFAKSFLKTLGRDAAAVARNPYGRYERSTVLEGP